jgi:uncharacterized protein YcbX
LRSDDGATGKTRDRGTSAVWHHPARENADRVERANMSIFLSGLHVYPVKSCAALSPLLARVERRGLAGDRRWMIVNAEGRFVTGREQPRLTLVRAEPHGDALELSAPGMESIRLCPPADGKRDPVTVWRSAVGACSADAAANAWISRFLDFESRFVFMDAAAVRPVDPRYGCAGDEVSFADGFPILLIGEGSLAELNRRLRTPVPMLRFRPNLIVAGAAPHTEDQWKRIRIGGVDFDVVKPCTRCVFTTVDPVTGKPDPHGEPLRTMRTYRSTPDGVCFGQNLIARSTGTVRIGDPVRIL